MWNTITITGVGLIGASIGRAIRQRGLARRVVGIGRSPESLRTALIKGAIDDVLPDEDAYGEADLIILCVPVDHIATLARTAALYAPDGCLITDAGSTKGDIVRQLSILPLREGVNFIGSHPIAGSEKKGPEYLNGDMFEGRVTVVTPTLDTPDAPLLQLEAFWRSLGSQVVRMGPEEHDEALALTSHLPHLAASALARLLPIDYQPLTGTGFRDTTRVAAGDPEIWTAIFQANRAAVDAALGRLIESLGEFRQGLRAGNATQLNSLLAQAKKVRDDLGS